MSREQIENIDPFSSLRRLRDDWSDEVPEEILHGGKGADSPKFKVRRNWWAAVFNYLNILILQGSLKVEEEREVKSFLIEYGEKIRNNLTTREDIEIANNLITKVVDGAR